MEVMSSMTQARLVLAFAVFMAVAYFAALYFKPLPVAAQAEPPIIVVEPNIYTMQFGVTVNKFIVLNDRLHLLVPLPVTGKSGSVIEIDKVARKASKGK